jgi:hypothetical protein
MSGSEPRHLEPGRAGQESHEAQSAFVGGGRSTPYLSASVFGDANGGSSGRRHPLVWAAAWAGGFVAVIAVLILILR